MNFKFKLDGTNQQMYARKNRNLLFAHSSDILITESLQTNQLKTQSLVSKNQRKPLAKLGISLEDLTIEKSKDKISQERQKLELCLPSMANRCAELQKLKHMPFCEEYGANESDLT